MKTTNHNKANHVKTRQKVMVFASQIYKLNPDLTWGEAMAYAWSEIRQQPTAELITFEKADGTTTSRIVFLNWNDYNEVKGTGRPLKRGQILFVDVAKQQSGLRSTISTYLNRITNTSSLDLYLKAEAYKSGLESLKWLKKRVNTAA
jgi:hypothetical protein